MTTGTKNVEKAFSSLSYRAVGVSRGIAGVIESGTAGLPMLGRQVVGMVSGLVGGAGAIALAAGVAIGIVFLAIRRKMQKDIDELWKGIGASNKKAAEENISMLNSELGVRTQAGKEKLSESSAKETLRSTIAGPDTEAGAAAKKAAALAEANARIGIAMDEARSIKVIQLASYQAFTNAQEAMTKAKKDGAGKSVMEALTNQRDEAEKVWKASYEKATSVIANAEHEIRLANLAKQQAAAEEQNTRASLQNKRIEERTKDYAERQALTDKAASLIEGLPKSSDTGYRSGSGAQSIWDSAFDSSANMTEQMDKAKMTKIQEEIRDLIRSGASVAVSSTGVFGPA
jgi:hypothetical protein